MHDCANFNKQNKLLGMCHINNHAQHKLPPCNAAIERASTRRDRPTRPDANLSLLLLSILKSPVHSLHNCNLHTNELALHALARMHGNESKATRTRRARGAHARAASGRHARAQRHFRGRDALDKVPTPHHNHHAPPPPARRRRPRPRVCSRRRRMRWRAASAT